MVTVWPVAYAVDQPRMVAWRPIVRVFMEAHDPNDQRLRLVSIADVSGLMSSSSTVSGVTA